MWSNFKSILLQLSSQIYTMAFLIFLIWEITKRWTYIQSTWHHILTSLICVCFPFFNYKENKFLPAFLYGPSLCLYSSPKQNMSGSAITFLWCFQAHAPPPPQLTGKLNFLNTLVPRIIFSSIIFRKIVIFLVT